MTDHERIKALIEYLTVLTAVSNGTSVKVFTEMHRTIAAIDSLLLK